MGFDLSGAFASVTENAGAAALKAASDQVKGAYAPAVDVAPTTTGTKPAGAVEASLPPQTTGSAPAPSFFAKNRTLLLIGGALAAVLAFLMVRRKRK